MLLPTLGSVGMGLVWGWLVGSPAGRMRRLYRTIPAVALATSAISAHVLWVLGWRGLAGFLGAALAAFLLRVGWLRELRHRCEPSTPE